MEFYCTTRRIMKKIVNILILVNLLSAGYLICSIYEENFLNKQEDNSKNYGIESNYYNYQKSILHLSCE